MAEFTGLEQAYINASAAVLIAHEDMRSADRMRKQAAKLLLAAAAPGEAALSDDRLAELNDEMVRVSGLDEDSEAVQSLRLAHALAQSIERGEFDGAGFGGF